jgi:hypothetical protein
MRGNRVLDGKQVMKQGKKKKKERKAKRTGNGREGRTRGCDCVAAAEGGGRGEKALKPSINKKVRAMEQDAKGIS